ncbi:hypothetical protein [Pseudonocardia parietis]|uniref:Uncharacterized protein n=1 Tax=Pseudonocardia parietis TaxID=570936 RepID=A0ABS4W398_9PSEU|nr:hypothetical protein [Pseudonocardia parietis]MBP2370678.1 hypothetical protein [Pseudonocardia parietis]
MSRLIVGGVILGILVAHAGPHTAGILGLGCIAITVWALAGRTRGGRAASGRAVMGHGHGTQRLISRHEAGHAAAARALGGRVRSMRMWKDGGMVQATLPTSDPQAAITFWRAGRHAAGTGTGCGADDDLVRRELRSVPRADRARVRRDADRDARRIVRRHASEIRRDAARMLKESD